MRLIRLLAAAVALVAIGTACGDGGNTTPPGNNPPTADFTAACQSFTCDFTDASTDNDGTIQSRDWDFGDGSAHSSDQNPTHTYAGTDPATYNVTLVVTDNENASSSPTTKPVNVGPSANLQCANGVDCTIDLTAKSIVTVTLQSADCQLTGNAFAITQPIQQQIFTDGCHQTTPAAPITLNGPNPDHSFDAGTSIQAAFTQGHGKPTDPALGSPAVRLTSTSAYPDWTIEFDDGGNPTDPLEPDFNDLVVTVHAQTVP